MYVSCRFVSSPVLDIISRNSHLRSLGRNWIWFQTPLYPLSITGGHLPLLAHLFLGNSKPHCSLTGRQTLNNPVTDLLSSQILLSSLSAIEDSRRKPKTHLNTEEQPYPTVVLHLTIPPSQTSHTITPNMRPFTHSRGFSYPTDSQQSGGQNLSLMCIGLNITSRVMPLSGLTKSLIMLTKSNIHLLNCLLTLQRQQACRRMASTALYFPKKTPLS